MSHARQGFRQACVLSGLRIVSMALNVPGPLAVSRLHEAGAQVTKIEPLAGDPLERICNGWYTELHRGVAVERLDLKSAAGTSRMRALLNDADLLVSSQRPSALRRLGLDTTSLAGVRWLNIVGDRAQPEVAGHDLTYQARAGLLGETLPPTLLADVIGGERAFAAALLLLRQPAGAHDEVGLSDSLAPLVAPLAHGLTAPGGVLGGGLPEYAVYRAKQGSVAVAALEPHFRERLYAALGLAGSGDLAGAMLGRTADEWERWAREHDLPIAAVARADR
jgi:crotonobetainyl-CoA:carnitine CoA-transferase CaiB-like acyl-CoA transferase